MKRLLPVLAVFVLVGYGYMDDNVHNVSPYDESSSPSASTLPKSSVASTSQPATGEIFISISVAAFVRNGTANNPTKVQVFKKVGTDDRAILRV